MAEPEATDIATATAIDEGAIAEHARPPQGELCPSCGCPIESDDRFCPACGASRGGKPITATPVEVPQRHFRCNNCGSEMAADPQQRSYICPFCDSTYVVEFSPAETNRQRPEFVIGFAVTREQAQEKFRSWLRENSWIRPGDLATATVAEKQKGIYLPFWSFSMLAQSSWSATIGEYWYRTETYTTTDSKGKRVTRTRQVQETEWWPLSGRHHHYYSGYLISASRGLPQDTALRIMPFNLPAMKRYAPYFLAGWLAEEYSVEREAALEICLNEFRNREQRNVAAFLPGNTHRGLEVRTSFSQTNSDLCLLPVYVLSYRYRDRLYRFLVNGQTGKCDGDKPLSWKRISAMVAAFLILAAIVVVLIAILNR